MAEPMREPRRRVETVTVEAAIIRAIKMARISGTPADWAAIARTLLAANVYAEVYDDGSVEVWERL